MKLNRYGKQLEEKKVDTTRNGSWTITIIEWEINLGKGRLDKEQFPGFESNSGR